MFSEQAKQKGIELTCACANAAHQAVDGDEGRLKEAIANFVSNALKFTEAGRVTLIVEVLDESAGGGGQPGHLELNIHVDDTGRGLSEEEQKKLFVPFETLRDDERGASPGPVKGTGLGLTIAKHIIAAHGGEVYVESAGVGAGSRFGFRIKLDKAGEESSREAWSELADGGGEGGGDDAGGDEGIRVLLVDDDEFNLEVVADMLLSLGWQCETAADGTQAMRQLGISPASAGGGGGLVSHSSAEARLEAAPGAVHTLTPLDAGGAAGGGESFSCIVTDNIMPVINGRELTRQCRAQLRDCPPIIGLTGSAQLEDLQACREAGMDTVLTKPVRLIDLAAAVRAAVSSAKNRTPTAGGAGRERSTLKALAAQDPWELPRAATSDPGVESPLSIVARSLDALDLEIDHLDLDPVQEPEHEAEMATRSLGREAGRALVSRHAQSVARRASPVEHVPGRLPTIPGLEIEGLEGRAVGWDGSPSSGSTSASTSASGQFGGSIHHDL